MQVTSPQRLQTPAPSPGPATTHDSCCWARLASRATGPITPPARPTVHTDTTALSGDSVQAPPFSSLGCGFILRGTAAGKPDSWLSYYWIQSRVSAANVYNVC